MRRSRARARTRTHSHARARAALVSCWRADACARISSRQPPGTPKRALAHPVRRCGTALAATAPCSLARGDQIGRRAHARPGRCGGRLQAGASVDVVNPLDGQTALHLSIAARSLTTARALLTEGALVPAHPRAACAHVRASRRADWHWAALVVRALPRTCETVTASPRLTWQGIYG